MVVHLPTPHSSTSSTAFTYRQHSSSARGSLMGCHCWETKGYSNERFLDLDNELERCAMDFEAKIFSDWKDAFMITVREKIRVGWEST